MYNFYLSPELQSSIEIGQRVLFSFSGLFNLTAFICLIKETPENQSKFRYYLCYIQILAAINDVNLGFLFEAFPLFPVFGAFCNGVLCRLGVPIHYSFAISVLIIGNIGASILICFFYRHQSIVRRNFNMARVHSILISKTSVKKFIKAMQCILIVLYSMPGIVSFAADFDYSQTEYFIDHFPYGNLSWIRDRGMYAVFVPSPSLLLIPKVTFAVLFIALILLISMIVQIAMNISSDVCCHTPQTRKFPTQTIRSAKTAKRNKHALQVLVFQLVIPVLLLIVPATIMMLSILLENLIPYEICLFSYQLLTFHTTTHSVVLLMITPAYRQFIRNFLFRLLKPKFLQRKRIHTLSALYNLETRG